MHDPQDPVGYPMGDEDAMSFEEQQEDRRGSRHGRRKTDGVVISRRGLIVAIASYVLVWVVLAIGVGFWQHEQRQSDRADTEQFAQLDSLVKTIQHERVNNIRDDCLAQNERYKNAVNALDTILDPIRQGADRTRITQIERTRTASILVITALAPHQNCNLVVRQSTGRSQAKTP